MTSDDNVLNSVFHEGERRMHEMLGIGDRQRELGLRMIRDHMPDQHRGFFAELPSVHLGVVDMDGHPWAILRTGTPGFLNSSDATTLTIASHPFPGEPDTLVFAPDAKISVLGLQMETRRRNRMNATIHDASAASLTLRVDQSYGNCPKYIQTRSRTEDDNRQTPASQFTGHLTEKDQALVAHSDLLMLATRVPKLTDDPRDGVDINHRGGNPGFVKVLDEQTIEFPDYKGNSFYNSFGNILLDQRVGLQFWDFETGTLLNLKGTAELVEYGQADLPLMGRSLRVHIQSAIRAEGATHLRYALQDYSTNNPNV